MRPPTFSSPPAAASPPLVADHEMLRRIGVGAYGEVWTARSITGAMRAVKVVWRQHFDHERTYEREFIGLKNFEPLSRAHDGLVDILHIGRNDDAGYFYCVMELADDAAAGEDYTPLTLAEYIKERGRLTISECARIGAAVAEALGYLHRQNLVHRDVKPSNIIFVNGHPKLADIGLVTSVGAARSFVGTDGFIPPEGPGSPRADIFGFGKTLYEMATGRSRLDFPDLPAGLETSGEAGLFAELNEIILRACAATPEGRHSTAGELRGELLLLDAGRSIRKMRRNERLLRTWRRAGMVAMLVVVMIGAALLLEKRATESARLQAETELRQRHKVEEKESAARHNLYAADMNLAQQAIDSGNYGRAEDLLAGYLPRPGVADLRSFEWRYFWRRVRGDSVGVLRGHTHLVSSLALGKNPGQLFSASFDRTLREWSMSELREARRWDLAGSIFTSLTVSADGNSLLAEGDRALSSMLDLRSGQWLTNSTTASSQSAFAPGGEKIVRGSQFKFFDTNGLIQVTDLAFKVEKVLPESGSRFAFSPRGDMLVTGAWADSLKFWKWPEGQLLGDVNGAGIVLRMRYSPTRPRAATVTRDGRLCLWDTASRALIRQVIAHGGAVVWGLAFSPNGNRIATGGSDQAVRIWDAETLRELHVYRGHGSEVWSVIWSADGGQIISAGKDMTIRIWNANPVVDTGEISTATQRPIFSPDNRRIAALVRDSGATVWDTSGKVIARIPDAVEVGGFGAGAKTLFILARDWEAREVSIADGAIISARKITPSKPDHTKRLLSADGRWLATGFRSGEVFAHDLHSEADAKSVAGLNEMVVSLAFSPDNTKLLAGSIDRTARLWNLKTGKTLQTFSGHRMGVGSVAFSADGRLVATGSWDDNLHVWDANTGARLMTLPGHEGGVQSVAFTPKSQTLVSMTGTSILKFWSLPAQREAGQVRLRPGVYQGWLTVSDDGEWLAAVNMAEGMTLFHAPREKNGEIR